MPIKFRCSYCRQFLGISRNRAGEVFDCPTCGRTIRVPGLDGSVAPLPEPELNTGDAHLARALDELAALANGNPVPQPVATALSDAEPEAQIPQPLPEPEPVELPLPPVITPVAPPGLSAAAVEEPPSSVLLADLLPLADTAPQASPVPTSTAGGVSLSRGWLAVVLFAPTIALLAGLQVGWWLGRAGRTPSPSVAAPVVAEVAADADAPSLSGRVSFRNDLGETKPDIGAVVILWPENWDGATRLPPVGLRSADSDADQSAAAGMVAGMGGALTRTGADGSYQLALPRTGRYRRLIISRLKARAKGEPLPPAVLGELQQYLSDPAAAIGERAYSWQPQTIDASNAPVDQVF